MDDPMPRCKLGFASVEVVLQYIQAHVPSDADSSCSESAI